MSIDVEALVILLEDAINDEAITQDHLDRVEQYLDRLFSSSGIDIGFTRHFLDRVNDARNGQPITIADLIDIFQKAYRKFNKGKSLIGIGMDAEAVLTDMDSDINIPFVISWNRRERELSIVSKTVMRKKNFHTPDQLFRV